MTTRRGSYTWSPEAWRAECVEQEREPSGLEATTVWRFANVGDIEGLAGELWEWCPAWWSRHYRGPEITDALEAISLAGWIERGAPWVVAGWPPAPPPEPLRRLLSLVMSAEVSILKSRYPKGDDDS